MLRRVMSTAEASSWRAAGGSPVRSTSDAKVNRSTEVDHGDRCGTWPGETTGICRGSLRMDDRRFVHPLTGLERAGPGGGGRALTPGDAAPSQPRDRQYDHRERG